MDAEFWHRKWESNDIGFHQGDVNPLLLAHFDALALPPGRRVFVPLCGKTRDIAWLLSRGYRVAGAELNGLAVTQLFEELGVTPEITEAGALTHYRCDDLDIFVGDIFQLSPEQLGPIDATYDRAALVALPAAMRTGYARHLTRITGFAPQILVAYSYDQAAMEGPPFSVSDGEVHEQYGSHYTPELLGRVAVPGGLKGLCPAEERVWLLKRTP